MNDTTLEKTTSPPDEAAAPSLQMAAREAARTVDFAIVGWLVVIAGF
jgi:hypothetical protein